MYKRWIRERAARQLQAVGRGASPVPWFAYQGMNIVHPPYNTNQYWFDSIDPAKAYALSGPHGTPPYRETPTIARYPLPIS